MLIIGAKGFAKEVLEVLYQLDIKENIAFYDDVNKDIGDYLFNKFPILKTEHQVIEYFSKVDTTFTIGIGNPILRYNLYKKFTALNGNFVSTISPFAKIGVFDNQIENGTNLMTNVVLTSSINIGKGALINLNCSIGHDTKIGNFVELCPGVNVSGNCIIENYTFIGTNATILPNIKIGKNVIVGAGSLVNKDLPDNVVAVGVPAKIIKEVTPLDFE
jgi:sugar O-acyltransferase (sialic acid O-acetyltransferase NeuD family)